MVVVCVTRTLELMTVKSDQMRVGQTSADRADPVDPVLQKKINQVVELTGRNKDDVIVALHDCDNDTNQAIIMLLEGESDQGEWHSSVRKSRKKQTATTPVAHKEELPPAVSKSERPDKSRERDRDDTRDGPPPRRGKQPPRMQRRNNREYEENQRNRDEDGGGGFERGGDFSSRRGRGRGGMMNGRGRGRGRRGDRSGPSDRYTRGQNNTSAPPTIDDWDNEETEPAQCSNDFSVSTWCGVAEESWDEWTGSLEETNVFEATQPPPTYVEPSSLFGAVSSEDPMFSSPSVDVSDSHDVFSSNGRPSGSVTTNGAVMPELAATALQDAMASSGLSNAAAILSNSLQAGSLTTSPPSAAASVTSPLGQRLDLGMLLKSAEAEAAAQQQQQSDFISQFTKPAPTPPAVATPSDPVHMTTQMAELEPVVTSSHHTQSLPSTHHTQSLHSSPSNPSHPSQQHPNHPSHQPLQQQTQLQSRPKVPRSKVPPPSKIPAKAVEMPGHLGHFNLDVQFGNWDASALSFGAVAPAAKVTFVADLGGPYPAAPGGPTEAGAVSAPSNHVSQVAPPPSVEAAAPTPPPPAIESLTPPPGHAPLYTGSASAPPPVSPTPTSRPNNPPISPPESISFPSTERKSSPSSYTSPRSQRSESPSASLTAAFPSAPAACAASPAQQQQQQQPGYVTAAAYQAYAAAAAAGRTASPPSSYTSPPSSYTPAAAPPSGPPPAPGLGFAPPPLSQYTSSFHASASAAPTTTFPQGYSTPSAAASSAYCSTPAGFHPRDATAAQAGPAAHTSTPSPFPSTSPAASSSYPAPSPYSRDPNPSPYTRDTPNNCQSNYANGSTHAYGGTPSQQSNSMSSSTSKLSDNISKMSLKENSHETVRQSTAQQYDSSSAASSSTSLPTSSSTLPVTTALGAALPPTAVPAKHGLPLTSKAPPNLAQGVPPVMSYSMIGQPTAGMPFGYAGMPQLQQFSYEELAVMQQRLPMPPTTLPGQRHDQQMPSSPYSGGDAKLGRLDAQSPVQAGGSAAAAAAAATQQQFMNPAALPPAAYNYYYPGLVPGAGYSAYPHPMFPAIPPVTNTAHAGTTPAAAPQFQKQGNFPHYGAGYEDPQVNQDFSKAYGSAPPAATKPQQTAATSVAEMSAAAYGKSGATPFDKAGFAAAATGTPPPFNLAAAMSGGSGAGPMGAGPMSAATAAAYGAPYLPAMMAAHQPHSHLLHHHLPQDSTGGSSRVSQAPPPKPGHPPKTYNTAYWGN